MGQERDMIDEGSLDWRCEALKRGKILDWGMGGLGYDMIPFTG